MAKNNQSKIKVTREIGFHKMYRAAGPDGPSSSFSKDGGEVLTSEVTNLGSFGAREEIFKD